MHNRELEKAEARFKQAKNLEDQRFQNQDFVQYLKIRVAFRFGIQPYDGLGKPLELLEAALQAKTSLEKIWQVELQYRGSKQQAYYNFIAALLPQNPRHWFSNG